MAERLGRMRHFSKHRPHSQATSLFPRIPVFLRRIVVCAALAGVTPVAFAADGEALPETELRTSPEIAPLAPRAAPPGTAQSAPVPPLPGQSKSPIVQSGATPAVLPIFGNSKNDDGAIFLRADRIETIGRKQVDAFGKVELRARGQTVLAEHLMYDVDDQTINAIGDVTLRKNGDWVTGPELKFKRDTETGYFLSPHFFVGEAGARGEAARIEFKGPNLYEVTDGRYTTCVAPRNDWFLQTREMTLDRTRNVGTAHDATVRFFETPIFYSPYLEFPLNNDRKSGFLTPTAGSTGTRGLELATPYYFNLAPNYDATLTPRIMTRRGIQVGGQLRYLFGAPQPMIGELDAEILPDDRVTNTNRYALSWRHSEQFAPWLSGFLNLNKVSDDTYFADLADRVAVTAQTTLPREAALTTGYGPLSATVHVQSFQTLQDPTQPIAPPYNMLPQITVNYAETNYFGLNWSGAAEYTQFRSATLPEGDRAVLYPQASWSREGAAWFFTARGSVHMRAYDLDPGKSTETHPRVAVPIASVDTGLTFERDWTLFGRDFVNTLEPRAFYVYIPYRSQNSLPVFDTAIDDFNFSQLFSENRYLGNDRIGDANQLTLALSSRLLDPRTGAERLRVAVGQRFYFADQRVTLGEQPRSGSSSDILLLAEGKLSDAWALQGLVQQNLDSGLNEQLNVGVRYTPALGSAINAGYRYTRQLVDPTTGLPQTIKQVDLSGEWPVTPNWTLLGRWNYSIPDKKTLEAIAGVEYNQDCWVLRVVFHRLITTTQQTTNSVFVQLELNGLARIGTSPLDLLRRSVPGYLRTNDPSLIDRDTRFDPMPDF